MLRRILRASKAIALALAAFAATIPLAASADTISVSPSAGTYQVGSTFTVRVLASSPNRSVNALSGTVSFPADKLQVVSVSKDNSIINLWVQDPSFSNVSGSFSFEGVVLNPGYTGSQGRVVSVTFRAIAPGAARLSFVTASMLANDGTGSNVLRVMEEANLSIAAAAPVAAPTVETASDLAPKAPVITSATHPDPESWYATSTAEFSWKVPAGVTAARLLYDKKPLSAPTVLYEEPISSKRVEGLSDGEYYFHVQLKNEHGWGGVGHYRFRIDTTPPKAFKITFPHGASMTIPQPIILFNTTDSGAGVLRYVVKVGEKDPLRVGPTADSNPYTLPAQDPGRHTVLVEAYDAAGNYSTASAEFNIQAIDRPIVDSYPESLSYGDIMKVRGVTYPNSTVNMYIRRNGELYFTDFTKSNSLGDWSVVVTKQLEPGAYQFSLDVTDATGAKSLETDPLTVMVTADPVTKILASVSTWVGLTVICLAALSALGFAFYLGCKSVKRARRALQRDVEVIGKGIHKAFDLLRDDVGDHVRSLERTKSKRDLTKEEEKMLQSLRQSLDDAERFLEDKLEDIKKDVK